MENITRIKKLNIEEVMQGTISRYWLQISSPRLKKSLLLPVFIAKGKEKGPTVGLTAVIHGNELNGLPVIQKIFETINVEELKGCIVGIPVLNIPGFLKGKRAFKEADLNRKMPGKAIGEWSDIYAHNFTDIILSQFHYLIDLHTAEEGEANSYYVRADISYPTIKKMALLQNPDIILQHKGAKGMLRRAAFKKKIPAITVEIGNPNIFQKKLIEQSVEGVYNVLKDLKMIKGKIKRGKKAVICKKSKWVKTDREGVLEVYPELKERVKKGQKVATIRNIFGDVLKEYKAPISGIVIGKSSSVVKAKRDGIIHIGTTR